MIAPKRFEFKMFFGTLSAGWLRLAGFPKCEVPALSQGS